MNNSNPLQTIFQGLSQKMKSDFDLLTSQFEHSLSTGEAREFVFKELLRQYLPPRLGVEKGVIISSVSDERPSKQVDVIIYDKLNTPTLYSAENLRIFPVEGVYAVIEVKSMLNNSSLSDALDNIHSVKQMTKRAFVPQGGIINKTFNLYGKETSYFPVLGFIFSYSSMQDIKSLKNQIESKDDLQNLEKNIDTVCILNRAIITNQTSESMVVVSKEPNTKRGFISTTDSLLLFYLLMMHVLPQTWMDPIKMTDYSPGVSFGTFEI